MLRRSRCPAEGEEAVAFIRVEQFPVRDGQPGRGDDLVVHMGEVPQEPGGDGRVDVVRQVLTAQAEPAVGLPRQDQRQRERRGERRDVLRPHLPARRVVPPALEGRFGMLLVEGEDDSCGDGRRRLGGGLREAVP
ncbi:hypothetical protein KEF29_00545 [Streptomyces tuirus]|uniref:Uncharacterized protein n=1 Tax=Streptomyces tuirus TaxID=68278 RepID=A0A941F7P0_9ACTN|nr:hypothetical protein [Streptomyces tuirus]